MQPLTDLRQWLGLRVDYHALSGLFIVSAQDMEVVYCHSYLDADACVLSWMRQMLALAARERIPPGASSLSPREHQAMTERFRRTAIRRRAEQKRESDVAILDRTLQVYGAVNEGVDGACAKTPDQVESDVTDLFPAD